MSLVRCSQHIMYGLNDFTNYYFKRGHCKNEDLLHPVGGSLGEISHADQLSLKTTVITSRPFMST